MATAQGTIGVAVVATDQASPTLDKLNKRLMDMRAPMEQLAKAFNGFNKQMADLDAPVKKVESSFSRFSTTVTANVKAITSGFMDMMRGIGNAAMSMARFIPMVGLLTGGGIVAGLTAVAIKTANYATNMRLAAFQTGMTVTQIQQLAKTAEAAGVSGDALVQTYKSLGQVMLAAQNGENSNVAAMNQAFGIKDSDSDDQVFRKLLPKLSKMDARHRQWAESQYNIEALDPLVLDFQKGKLSADQAVAASTKPLTNKEIEEQNDLRRKGVGVEQQAESLAFHAIAKAAPELSSALDKINASLKDMNDNLDNLLRDKDPILKMLEQWKVGFGALAAVIGLSLVGPLMKVVEGMRGLIGLAASPEGMALLAAMGIFMTPGDQAVGPQPKETGITNWLGEDSPVGKWIHKWMGGGTGQGSGDFNSGIASGITGSPLMRGLLDTISQTEGADYNSRVGERRGQGTLDINGPHPQEVAGRYQFLQSTWREGIKSLHLPDVMSKENQDKVAEWLVRRAGVTDDMLSDPNRRQEVVDRLKATWVSFPGGSQQTTSMDNFNKIIQAATSREQGAPGTFPAEPSVPVAGQKGANGKITVDVNHSGTPAPGFNMNVRPSGPAFWNAPPTGYPMPIFGP